MVDLMIVLILMLNDWYWSVVMMIFDSLGKFDFMVVMIVFCMMVGSL